MLEDQPMRYLRAAGMIARDPRQLRAQLRQLLGDTPDTRTHAEQARADALAEMAAATSATACPDDAAGADEPRADPDPSRLVLRTGTVADVPELVALHARCSADTLYRRYHAPMSRLGPRMARRILQPAGGNSLVRCEGHTIVAAGMLAAGDEGLDVGLLVQDRRLRRGPGTGSRTPWPVTPRARATRPSPVWSSPTTTPCCAPWTRADLRAHLRMVEDLVRYTIRVGNIAEDKHAPLHRPATGSVTVGRVEPLHRQPDLRQLDRPSGPAALLKEHNS
jgi:hypothetical protein